MSSPWPGALAGLVLGVALCLAEQDWTYEGSNGPSQWSRLGYKECDHHQQSPIDIHSKSVQQKHLQPLELHFFDHAPLSANVTNNYVGALVTLTSGHVPLVRAGSLYGEYSVVGFHFHWGENDTVGSEHKLDGHSYPLEMHILCQNTKYGSLTKATQRPDGLAVLAVWFEVGPSPNSGLMRLSPALDRIRAGGASTLLSEPPSLLELMPNDLGHFYRYEGSLTTPGCYEVVTWTIFKQPVQATEQQMALFRTLTGLRSRPIGHNYRLVQLPYGRQVFERLPLDEAALEMKSQRDSQEAAASGPKSSATAAVASLLLLQLAATLTTLSTAVALTVRS